MSSEARLLRFHIHPLCVRNLYGHNYKHHEATYNDHATSYSTINDSVTTDSHLQPKGI